MPLYHRQEKTNALLEAEINKLLLKEVELPIGTLTTLMRVETDGDFEHSRIWVSVLPFSRKDEILAILRHITPHFQRLLIKRLRMEYVPTITFAIDDTNEKADHIEHLLDDVKEDTKKTI